MNTLHDLSEFFHLSAMVNYQLAGRDVGVPNVVALLDPDITLSEGERETLAEVLEYLLNAYGETRRRLGPLAILHPIRCAALLGKATGEPTLLNLLTALLHDKLEDFRSGELDDDDQRRFEQLLSRLDADGEWFLMERLDWLTREEQGQTYYAYMGQLLSHSLTTPEIVRVKLADRLDNTLDMRVALRDPLEEVDFFATAFALLYLPSFKGYRPRTARPAPSPYNGATRLYQLFKNTVMLSLVRQAFPDRDDAVVARLYDALARASMREAQRIVLHLFGYHITDAREQRQVLADAMSYCQQGGAARVGDPQGAELLDGFFIERFDHLDPKRRKRAIAELYEDKPLMARAATTLVSTFQAFLSDPEFRVEGLSVHGCDPVIPS